MAFLLAVAACGARPDPRYVLGAPYQADGVWYYPRDSYAAVETGLASVATGRHPNLTANGEAFDADAVAGAHQTLQLPAIARVTNLENGLQMQVRINDRGPARPHRLLELTPRAAALLGVPPSGGTQIKLEVLDLESRQAVEGLRGTPRIEVATAPRCAVRSEALDGGPAGREGAASPTFEPPAQASPRGEASRIRVAPSPGMLWVRLGTFSRSEYAERRRAQLAGLAPFIETEREGRETKFRVLVGPLADVATADAALDQAIRAGVSDARIVVE
jgi:rare lipoprotein A